MKLAYMSYNRLLLCGCYCILLLLFASCATSDNKPKQNRLKDASSPYLKQHADNPVDWFEWSDEALAKAKNENKPLLVSIGYASCHWCHVMEKESFNDTAVARLMNESFVCIKVDREERPDIDNLYMHACQLLNNGEAGWPLNAFALPDGKPFFAGTYYSKDNWISLLRQIADTYKNKNGKVIMQANALTYGIIDNDSLLFNDSFTGNEISKDFYNSFFKNVSNNIDDVNGGIKGQQKFPNPSLWQGLLQYQYLTGNTASLKTSLLTINKIALGGIYDHIGGGFYRYATDSLWQVPHFEKMLCDNGQLTSLFAQAYQLTKNDYYKNILEETISFVDDELSANNGGFYSSLNADTKDGEGSFYIWSYEQLKNISKETNAGWVLDYYNVSPQGNMDVSKADGEVSNVLFAKELPGVYAAEHNITPLKFSQQQSEFKKALLKARLKRDKPSVDDKIITSWNAMMLKGLVDAYSATGNEVYLKRALTNAVFLEKHLLNADGSVARNYSENGKGIEGFLDDYAWLANAYIQLYQVSFDKHWLEVAKKVADSAINKFYDDKSGLFFYTSNSSTSLAVRKFEIKDNAIPSSNSVMATVLYKLSVFFDEEDYYTKCNRMLSAVSNGMVENAAYYATWYSLAGLVAYGVKEVAIMGTEAHTFNSRLQKNYLPACLFMGDVNKENLPLLEGKLPVTGTMIYVCSNKSCKMPVREVEKAYVQLEGNASPKNIL